MTFDITPIVEAVVAVVCAVVTCVLIPYIKSKTTAEQMISDYNKWSERGYAPIYARENFENCWKQYHSLGVNGVMDDLHEKFLELPTTPVNEN